MKVSLTWAVLLIAGSASTVYAENPNVLFIAIDDLNDWVGCFGGNPQVKTPNLDRFAAEGGMVMMNAHAPATVCCPSRSALLTGVHAHKTGVYGNKNNLKNAPKAKDLVTLPEYLASTATTHSRWGRSSTGIRFLETKGAKSPTQANGPSTSTTRRLAALDLRASNGP